MGRIYLIRHGETDGNVKAVFRGKMDLPLNARGRAEGARIADLLLPCGITRILSSPLSRAKETAAPLAARLHLAVESDPGFDDIDVGQWQGMEVSEVEKRHPNLFQIWRNSPAIFRFPHGDSLAALQERAHKRLLEVARDTGEGATAVFTHQIVTRVLTLAAMDLPLSAYWRLHQTTGAVNALEWTNDEFRLLGFNLTLLDPAPGGDSARTGPEAPRA